MVNPTLLRVPRPILYGGLTLVLLAILGTVASHYWSELRWIAAPVEYSRPMPRVAPETKRSERMAEEVVERPVIVKRPTPKQAKKIKADYKDQAPDLKLEEILKEVEVGKLPYGGKALVTLDQAGETRVVVAPHRPPFFELGGPWKLGAGPLYHTEMGPGMRLRGGKEIGRVWRATLSVEADLDVYDGQAKGTVAALAEIKF